MENIISKIKKNKIISIIRTNKEYDIELIVGALYRAGIRIVEVTLNTPNALLSIEKIKDKYPDMIVGAGTVLNEEDVKNAINSGASFLLSPILDKKSIEVANEHDILMVPGVFTPTEAYKAYIYGAKMVKFFPAASVGASYVSDIKGPLSEIDVMSVGGINISNAEEFLKKGSCSLGVGGSIVSNDDIIKKDYLRIEKKAKEFVDLVENLKVNNK